MNKIKKVKKILKNQKIAIAFSGGADSTLISYLAQKVCHKPLAITINNQLMPHNFIKNTKKICKKLKIKQKIININFYKNKQIIKNPPNRCYLCRDEMYKAIQKTAQKEGYTTIVDGTNISDLTQDRPGILINYKNNIKSPFIDAQLNSKEIHQYLQNKKIPYSTSTTCLATRIPFHKQLTPQKLKKIDSCEKTIYNNTHCKIVKFRSISKTTHIIEVDNIQELLKKNKLKKIQKKLNKKIQGKIYLNINPIQNNQKITLNYKNNKFTYKLPYNIDLNKTKIPNKKITIKKDGTIIGDNFKSYQEALNEFIKILPHIRRTLP